MFFQWILDLIVSSEWILRSSKPCLARVFVGDPFLCCLCRAIFKLRQVVDVRKWKKTDLVFDVILYFRGCFVSFCPSFVVAFVFLEI